MRRLIALIPSILLVVSVVSKASGANSPVSDSSIPPQLTPWIAWVLEPHSQRTCVPLHNARPPLLSEQHHICRWYGQVKLQLATDKLGFSLTVRQEAEGWVPLPGQTALWPVNVRVNGNRLPVVGINGVPHLWLPAGSYQAVGELSWQAMPQHITLPDEYADIRLELASAMKGKAYLGEDQKVWLIRDRVEATAKADSLQVQVFRRLNDTIPKYLDSLVVLDVSGSEREAILGPLQLPGWEVLRLKSKLPVQLTPTGAVRVQLRPGRWTIEADFRQQTAGDQIALPVAVAGSWPAYELWSVKTHPALRRVEIRANAIDPLQTNLPDHWKKLPAYRLSPDSPLELVEMARGIVQPPENQFAQESQAWLGFAGSHWTWHDLLRGTMHQGWRLDQAKPFVLGQVKVNNELSLISTSADGAEQGVEIRDSKLVLDAVSTLEVDRDGFAFRLPATGWRASETELNQVRTALHLGPGWWPLFTLGTDASVGTWFDNWTLWDLFLLLLIAVAFWRLEGWVAGLIALVSLAFAFHESLAVTGIWLLALIPVALSRTITEPAWVSRIQKVRWILLVMVALLLLEYAGQQLKLTFFPQLDHSSSARSVTSQPVAIEELEMEAVYDQAMQSGRAVSKRYLPVPATVELSAPDIQSAPLTTGPGIPDWQGHTTHVEMNGPVRSDHHYELWALSPMQTRVMRVLHLWGLGYLLFVLASGASRFGRRTTATAASIGAAMLLVGVMAFIPSPVLAQMQQPLPPEKAGNTPDPALLSELEQRLLSGPPCLPDCADFPQVEVALDGFNLTLSAQMAVVADVAVPIPTGQDGWQPERVFVNGREVELLRRAELGDQAASRQKGRPASVEGQASVWFVRPGPGVHELVLEGAVKELDQFGLHFPIAPQQVQTRVSDWMIKGLKGQRLLEDQLTFERRSHRQRVLEKRDTLFPAPAPPFVEVTRRLSFGLEWRVITTVRRIAPDRGLISLAIPLIPGERVVSEDIKVSDGQARIQLADDVKQRSWNSLLPVTPNLTLQAQENGAMSERWLVSAEPVWSLTYSGVAPYRLVENDAWAPQWRPRPGDSLLLQIRQPEPVTGQYLTIDKARLHQLAGQHLDKFELELQMRSSKSQRFAFALPEGGVLNSVLLNGEAISLDGESGVDVILGLGGQNLQVSWESPVAGFRWHIRQPELNLPIRVFNISQSIQMPADYWPVWTHGPIMGPAVLYWGVVGVILILALILGRHAGNPLGIGSWLVLGAGATLGWVGGLLLLVAWFYLLNYQQQMIRSYRPWVRPVLRLLVILLTIAVSAWLILSIPQGLLGEPASYVAGQGSSRAYLRWYQDGTGGTLPTPGVYSLPLWIYRLLVLAWALWLAFAVLRWVRWGWGKFTEPATTAPKTGAETDTETDGETNWAARQQMREAFIHAPASLATQGVSEEETGRDSTQVAATQDGQVNEERQGSPPTKPEH